MEVLNPPKVNYLKKNLEFFLSDRRKIVSAIAALMLPIVNNLWRVLPDDVPIAFYPSISVFGWTFGLHFMLVVISIAWWFSVNSKDYVLQFFSLGTLLYSIFLSYITLPFTDSTMLWQDMLASLSVFGCIIGTSFFIKKRYRRSPVDYKAMHDGLVHDLHHQKFLGSISRIEGLLHLESEKENEMNQMMLDEIHSLKESIYYINEKYQRLN